MVILLTLMTLVLSTNAYCADRKVSITFKQSDQFEVANQMLLLRT